MRSHQPAAGKQTLVEQFVAPVVERHVVNRHDPSDEVAMHAAASRGVATPASPVPFSDGLQSMFGRHDVSSIQAHTGPRPPRPAKPWTPKRTQWAITSSWEAIQRKQDKNDDKILENQTSLLTTEIDLASDAAASKSTRGPAGKGFDKSLGVSASDLEALCKDLLDKSGTAGKGVP